MIRRPPRSTPGRTLFPYTTLFRSDVAAVGDLVEEAEEGDLVFPEARRPIGADVHDGDRGGGQRRQHQPLLEVSAAEEPPGFVPLHSRRRRR